MPGDCVTISEPAGTEDDLIPTDGEFTKRKGVSWSGPVLYGRLNDAGNGDCSDVPRVPCGAFAGIRHAVL